MRVGAIQEWIVQFQDHLSQRADLPAIWEISTHFERNWDPKTENISEMFSRSLHSLQCRSYWKRDRYEPRENMILLMECQADFMRQAFRELFDESIEIGVRIDRFIFYCDQVLIQFRKENPRSVVNNHNQDYEIIALYLALHQPTLYAPYQFHSFRSICKLFEAMPIPEVDDLPRYFKLIKILKRFLSQNPEISSLYEKKARLSKLNFENPMETTYPAAEFCAYCSGVNML